MIYGDRATGRGIVGYREYDITAKSYLCQCETYDDG